MPEATLNQWLSYEADQPDLHLLQTGEWGELKSGFDWMAIRILRGSAGVQILLRKLAPGLTAAYIPKAALQDDLLPEIDAACRKRGAIFCKWEPDAWEPEGETEREQWTDRGFISSAQNIQPPRTLLVDLQGSEDEILGRMKQKTRYNIRLAAKKGVIVRPWQDLKAFHDMLLVTGGRDGFGIHALEYYRRAYELFHPAGMAELLVAEFEGRPLAALMIFGRGKRAWYVYGASNDDERSRMPTYLLQWEAMRWVKAIGCEVYDLWGVPDEEKGTLEEGFESRSDGLWGVYRFKRGFGGQLRRAVMSLDRVYRPLLYKLYVRAMNRR